MKLGQGDSVKTEVGVHNMYFFVFMFVPCINSIKALFYYSKLMHKIIKS
jgi:hypothetical protein